MPDLTNERLNELSTMYGGDSGILEEAIKETAEMAREILLLRGKMAELRGQEPHTYVLFDGDDVEYNSTNEFSCGRTGGIPLYASPVPPAASQPMPTHEATDWQVNEAIAHMESEADMVLVPRGLLGAARRAINHPFHESGRTLGALRHYSRAKKVSQPYTVPDEITQADAPELQEIAAEAERLGIKGFYGAFAVGANWMRNRCRAAMLQHGTFIDEGTIHSGDVANKVNSPVIPDGWALVPSTIYLDESDVESICSQCGDGGGNYGDFTRGMLWVGDIQDDEGNVTHGLHISSDDYPEEGGITLAKFSAAPQHKGE